MVFETYETNSYEEIDDGNLLVGYWTEQKFLLIAYISMGFIFFLPVGIFYLIRFSKSKRTYLKITELIRDGNQKELVRLVNDNIDSFNVRAIMMGLYALADMKSSALEETIGVFMKALEFKATIKASSARSLCDDLLWTAKRRKESRFKTKELTETAETIIPITKLYFVEEDKVQEEKCMISGIRIDVKGEKIVACPKCGHFAKKELLDKWLNEIEKCPLCRNRITITDCPEVRIKERK